MSTIKDIALKANVSVTTVSRVLNKNGYVHQDTKKIIEDAIIELNYLPNTTSTLDKDGNIKYIGLLIDNITSTISSKIVECIEKLANQKGYKIILGITRNLKGLEDYYHTTFKDNNVVGIIIANTPINLDKFILLNKPIVSINNSFNSSFPSIKANYSLGAKLAALELVNNDCKNILIIKYMNDDINKVQSFINILVENNITYSIHEIKNNFEKQDINLIIDKRNYDAIYTTCDLIALSVITSLQKHKIKIPEQCCIIGFDNSSFTNLINPSLSSIDYPVDKISNNAFTTLYNNITNDDKIIKHETIDVNFIKRESTTK